MTDDKALVDAYSSIYKKKEEIKEEVQQLDEALPLAIPALIKGAGLAMKALKIGRKVHQGVQVAKGLVNTMKGDKQMQTAGHEPEGEMIEDVAITHLDGTTTEVIDVIKPEPLGNPDEKLADRLWDQVAANLTTLGEMGDTRYRVSPVEELEEKKKSKMADKDYDGDGKVESGTDEYMGSKDKAIKKAMAMKKEGFNVKSPVIFSKPEEKVEETISEEIIEKHASSISKAHKAIQK